MSTENCSLAATTITPKASYEQVVADRELFMETLEDLHKSLGTKFMVPTIGGKPLDLHFLFVEVTCRGGLQKVISDRKWREVIAAFAFPPSVTNASFVLRKYYISLLQTYEQVYFFRNGNSQIVSSDGEAKASSVSEALQPHEATMSTKLKGTEEHHIHEQPPLRVGCTVKGKINEKFEDGYIVTASFGSETLNGILYHVPLKQFDTQNSPFGVSHSRARKRSRKGADPSNHQPEPGSYNLFVAEQYSKLRPLHSGKEKVIFKQINDLWDKLTDSEREVYEREDKGR